MKLFYNSVNFVAGIRRYLQYLWLRGIHYRKIIDYIGATEGSRYYRYIRTSCEDEYSQMCDSMSSVLKENGFDMIFRNIIIAPFYYERIFNILKRGSDPVMVKRVNETMRGSMGYLLIKVFLIWAIKLFRDSKMKVFAILRSMKWHNNGIHIETIRIMVNDIDFNCVIISNKFIKTLSALHSEIHKSLCQNEEQITFL